MEWNRLRRRHSGEPSGEPSGEHRGEPSGGHNGEPSGEHSGEHSGEQGEGMRDDTREPIPHSRRLEEG